MAEAEGCRYLDFDESSTNGTPETHSGSLQMFHPECGFEKVQYHPVAALPKKGGTAVSSPPGIPTLLLAVHSLPALLRLAAGLKCVESSLAFVKSCHDRLRTRKHA